MAAARLVRGVRLLPVLAVLLLAGCAAPAEPEEPLFGYCPEWVQGPGTQQGTLEAAGGAAAAQATVTPANLTHLGLPLDLYRFRVTGLEVEGGLLRVRAFANDTRQLSLRDLRGERPEVVPMISYPSGTNSTVEFEAMLTSVLHDQPPAPGPVRLEATLEGNGTARLAFEATFHYKVCGA